MASLHPARIFDIGHHLIAQGLHVERRVTRHQGQPTARRATGRHQRVEGASLARALYFRRCPVQQIDAAHAGAAQLHITAKIDQHAVTMVRISNDNTGWVHVASDAHPQIAPTGQLQAAIAGDPARAAHCQDQALAMGVYGTVAEAITQRVQDPCVATDIDIQIAPAQGAEAGETQHLVRACGCGVTAEIDPPGGRLSLPTRRHIAAALAP